MTLTRRITLAANSACRSSARAGSGCSRRTRPVNSERTGLSNKYVPVDAADGQPRHCGGCGAQFTALTGAKAMICEGCGRRVDIGAAEIPCATCGATMTLPAGGERVACPFCQSMVERSGIR